MDAKTFIENLQGLTPTEAWASSLREVEETVLDFVGITFDANKSAFVMLSKNSDTTRFCEKMVKISGKVRNVIELGLKDKGSDEIGGGFLFASIFNRFVNPKLGTKERGIEAMKKTQSVLNKYGIPFNKTDSGYFVLNAKGLPEGLETAWRIVTATAVTISGGDPKLVLTQSLKLGTINGLNRAKRRNAAKAKADAAKPKTEAATNAKAVSVNRKELPKTVERIRGFLNGETVELTKELIGSSNGDDLMDSAKYAVSQMNQIQLRELLNFVSKRLEKAPRKTKKSVETTEAVTTA